MQKTCKKKNKNKKTSKHLSATNMQTQMQKIMKKNAASGCAFFCIFFGGLRSSKTKKTAKTRGTCKTQCGKKKKNEKHAKKHAKKSAEKMQLLELCIFAFLVGPPVRTAKSHKNCKNSRNMQKQCKKHAKKMPKKSDKHANSGTVHVLQKKQISRSCMFFACICCRGFWGCTFWVHCFCICFAFLSSFRPRISCFLLHNCNKSAAKCCDNVFFLVEFTSGTHTIICANYQSYPKRACFTRTSS